MFTMDRDRSDVLDSDVCITDVLDLAIANPDAVTYAVVMETKMPPMAPPATDSPSRPRPDPRQQHAPSPGAPGSINDYAAAFSRPMGGPQGWTLRMRSAELAQAPQAPDSSAPQAAANTMPQSPTATSPIQFTLTRDSDADSNSSKTDTATLIDNVAETFDRHIQDSNSKVETAHKRT